MNFKLIRQGYKESVGREMSGEDFDAFLKLARMARIDITDTSTYQEIHQSILNYMDFVSEQMELCESNDDARDLLCMAYGGIKD